MRILSWLGPQLSGVNGIALVEVAAGEVAEVEKMLELVDGDSVGHFGVDVCLVATDEAPSLRARRERGRVIPGRYDAEPQFGFVNASELRKRVRYYKVFVHRD